MRPLRFALCASLMVLSLAAMGQTISGDMVVDVPFAFVVAKQELPAGHYIVKAVDDDHLRIFNSQTVGLYVATHGTTRATTKGSKLVFHRYGDTYFLSAAWVSGNTAGRELFRSRAERELAEHGAEMEVAEVRPEK
jgi:hypothetical protein